MDKGVHSSKLAEAISVALSALQGSKLLKHEHTSKCHRILRPILYPNEETVLEITQSGIKSLSPRGIVATNQRLIIIKPSYWYLHMGRNLISSTSYETIPYNRIVSITLDDGILLSTLNMRLDAGTVVTKGEEIEGLEQDDAKTMFIFLEKVTGYLQDYNKAKGEGAVYEPDAKIGHINMEKARRLVKQKDAKFVWLGIEPIEYAAECLCIDKQDIIKINIDEFERKGSAELQQLDGYIFTCYDGVLSGHVANALKQRYRINAYTLKGGIEAQLREGTIEYI